MHRYLANYYGFSIIDIHDYYQNNEMIEFGNKFSVHQLAVVNRNIGKEIAKNIDIFKISKMTLDINLPEFKIATPENMQRNGNFKIFNPNNSMYNEIVYRLEKGNSLSFNDCDGYEIIGMHSWNLENSGEITKLGWYVATMHCGSIYLKNKNYNVVKSISKLNVVCKIQVEPKVDSNLIVKFNDENLEYTEFYHAAFIDRSDSIILPYFDIIALLLCNPNPNMKLFDLSVIPTDKDIEIDKDIDHSYLIPNIVFFKDYMEFIDEYIGHLYPNIVKHIDSVLTPQIQPSTQLSLEAENKIIKDKIKELETNYQKALNTKNHLSYKLGEALIKANKNWYKGGYVKFIFEAMRIKKEHKNRG
jgi:hypothetical protein